MLGFHIFKLIEKLKEKILKTRSHRLAPQNEEFCGLRKIFTAYLFLYLIYTQQTTQMIEIPSLSRLY